MRVWRKCLLRDLGLPSNASYVQVAERLIHARADWLVEPPQDADLAQQLIVFDYWQRGSIVFDYWRAAR